MMKTKFLGFSLTCFLGLLAAWSCGGDKCDPGYELSNHTCVPAAPSSGGSSSAGESSSDGSAGENSDSGGNAGDGAPAGGAPSCSTTFGDSCTEAGNCSCDTNFCAAMPGQTGFCTHDGCLEDPDVCPDGWSCMDLSSFVPDLSMCVE
jgi:hypothetical protein